MAATARHRSDLSWLRLAREMTGLSQAELADRAGVTQAQISHYESGRSAPREATLQRLAGALGVRAERLFPANGSVTVEEWLETYLAPSERSRAWAMEHLAEPEDDDPPPHWDDPDSDPDVPSMPPELRDAEPVVYLDEFRVDYYKGGKRVGVHTVDGLRFRVGGATVQVSADRRGQHRTPGRSNRPGGRRTQRSARSSPDGSEDGPEPPPHPGRGRA
jgi:transcriptional regulator with XRE-family HTH domain